jgi:heptosyltransferase-2
MPVVDYYLKLAGELGCGPESPRLELPFTEEDARAGDCLWNQLGLRNDDRVVVVNSSGAFGAAKIWPTEHAAVLAWRIAEELDHDVIILCGPREREAARKTAELAGHPRVFAIPPELIGIPTSKACIRRCRVMVSTDSGPRHIAAAFGKPVVTLFGPTDPVWVENPTVRGVDLRLELDCIGCRRRVCPLGHHRCMKDLLPGMVFSAVERSLTQVSSRRPRPECRGPQEPCVLHGRAPSRLK